MQTTDAETSATLRITEAAAYIRVHPDTLRRWADAGKVPCYRTPGGERRFAPADLRNVLTDQAAAS